MAISFRGIRLKARKVKTAEEFEADPQRPLMTPNCFINARTGSWVHNQPHVCPPQARSRMKPRKKRHDYIKQRRKMSRVRTGKR